jgi:O-antigen/teichoic acid export membrane protein
MSRVGRNLAINVTGGVLPICSALITVPIYLNLIGPGRYGIVAITWTLLGYFGFVDFGLSRAASNALGRLGHAPASERGPVFVTAFWLHVALGLLGGLFMYAAGDLLLRHAFSVSGTLRQETLAAFPWMVPMLPLGLILAVANGSLESRERFLTSNAFTSVGTVLGQVLPILAILAFGPSLTVVVPAIMLARLVLVIATYAVVVPSEWPLRIFSLDLGCARNLIGYGAWVTVTALIAPMLDTFDQMLIGRMMGPVAVAHYAVPMNLSVRSQVLATALARTLFPRMSRADKDSADRMARHATISLAYAFGAVCSGAIVVCGPFLRLWVGADFAGSAAPVAQILILGAWANGVGFIPYSQLQAQGRPDVTAKIHAAEIVPFVLGLWLLIHWGGLRGAAWAWTLRTSGDCLALLVFARYLRGSFRRALPALGLMLAAFAVASAVPMGLAMAIAVGSGFGVLLLAAGMAAEPVLSQAARHGLDRALAWQPWRPRAEEVSQ